MPSLPSVPPTAPRAGAATAAKTAPPAVAVAAPTITSDSNLPEGVTGVDYTQQLSATGTAPLMWTVSSGLMPPGLTLSPIGVISGTPQLVGRARTGFVFTAQVTSASGLSASRNFALSIDLRTDLNGDGVVNCYEYNIWSAHLNQAGTFQQGDFDLNGIVDLQDFAILMNEYTGPSDAETNC
ncbi:putative Ig domain-containing protein [Jatrophihabitans sp. GAS493]|uniref:putative Ig domain-containing protein n=1 Tax=Jatrophihabitans sp. GAS493 TaxID=1907575 RepID=UPI0012FDF49E|nr:putative Ig domain-containing protein [Jatrophihabitans sp. GAS493]